MEKLHHNMDKIPLKIEPHKIKNCNLAAQAIEELTGGIRLLKQVAHSSDDQLKFQVPKLQVATTIRELAEINQLRSRIYQDVYPSIDVYDDNYDKDAVIYYSRNNNGQVDSTARLVSNEGIGMPDEYLFSDSIQSYLRGKRVFELGRFIVENGSLPLLKQYYKAFYFTAQALGADYILMVMKNKDISLHRRIMNAQVLTKDIGTTYGGLHKLACVVWNINETPNTFFDWAGA